MRKLSSSFFLGLFLALFCVGPLHGQTVNEAPVQKSARGTAQAPDEMTDKITRLVDAGSYAEAQQLTTGLLVAYPDDLRLIKAKALLEKMLAAPASLKGTPEEQPNRGLATASPQLLTGEDKLDYNALIELARQSQQSSEMEEQHKLLRQFMEQSAEFLQRHPEQMLLWQLVPQRRLEWLSRWSDLRPVRDC